MAFTTGSASNYVDLLDDLITFVTAHGWTVKMQSKEAASAVVAAGGSGYSVNDQLTLVGGNGVTTSAVFNVDSVTTGAVTAVSLVTAGAYDYEPANPVSTTVSPAGGTGCTLTVTWAPLTGITVPKKVILMGDGDASDEIFVSIRAEDLGSSIYNWQLQGHVGFQDQVDPTLQPNTSPGVHVPMNNGAISYWLFATGRRIIGVFRMGSTYTNMYLGFLNQFGTAATYPYPLAIFGCAALPTIFSDSTTGMGGLSDPISTSSSSSGPSPAYVIDPGGTWKQVKNGGGSAGSRTKFHDLVVAPAGVPTTTGTWRSDTFFQPVQGSPTAVMGQTPDSGASSGWRFPLFPAVLLESSPVVQALGVLDGVAWAGTLPEAVGQAVSEDIYNINGTNYLLFQNVNRTDHWTVNFIKQA